MKLVQAVALTTGLPRRQAAHLIDEGKVLLNGKICTEYAFQLDIERDKIVVKDFENKEKNLANLKSPKKFIPKELDRKVLSKKHYFAFHKPKGIETTLNGKPGSLSPFVKQIGIRSLKPVGRLDLDSEGLLLFTDDGDFIQKFTHPSHQVSKIYEVWVKGLKSEEQLQHLGSEFTILKVQKDSQRRECDLLVIELKEGKNRQIRRCCAKYGLFVERILRIAIGNVQLRKLKPGEWIALDPRSI